MKQVVEYQGIPVGVLIPREGCLAFMAVKYDVIELDGERFSSAAEARAAVQVQMRRRDRGFQWDRGRRCSHNSSKIEIQSTERSRDIDSIGFHAAESGLGVLTGLSRFKLAR